MRVFEISKHLTIECKVYETSRSWGHTAKVYRGGQEVARDRVRYYNRTWEKWQFASLLSCFTENKHLTQEEQGQIKKYLEDN